LNFDGNWGLLKKIVVKIDSCYHGRIYCLPSVYRSVTKEKIQIINRGKKRGDGQKVLKREMGK
jgi:hypothetical protein